MGMIATAYRQRQGDRRLRWRDESGKASWRGLVALLLVAGLVYFGVKVIPVRTAAYQFEDAIRDEVLAATSRRRMPDEQIRKNLLDTAAELSLPIRPDDITIRRPGGRSLIVEADYTVTLEFLGGYTYDWRFTPRDEKPLIFR